MQIRGFAYIDETKETFAVSVRNLLIFKIDVSNGELTEIADFSAQFPPGSTRFTGITRHPTIKYPEGKLLVSVRRNADAINKSQTDIFDLCKGMRKCPRN